MHLVGAETPEPDVNVTLESVQQRNPQEVPTDTPVETVEVDSIDLMDVDSKNKEGYSLCGKSGVVSSLDCVYM